MIFSKILSELIILFYYLIKEYYIIWNKISG